jgi:hypothetical protein
VVYWLACHSVRVPTAAGPAYVHSSVLVPRWRVAVVVLLPVPVQCTYAYASAPVLARALDACVRWVSRGAQQVPSLLCWLGTRGTSPRHGEAEAGSKRREDPFVLVAKSTSHITCMHYPRKVMLMHAGRR